MGLTTIGTIKDVGNVPYFHVTDTVSTDLGGNPYIPSSVASGCGWNGIHPVKFTLNVTSSGIISDLYAQGAILITALPRKSIVIINNNGGLIYGTGGGIGSITSNNPGTTQWAMGNPPYPPPGASGYAPYYAGPGIGGSWPQYNSFSGGTSPSGGTGGIGYPAITLVCQAYVIINNAGTIVGGGGGAGGQAGNNAGGGAGGQGGYAITDVSGGTQYSHPDVILNNLAGGMVSGGGGGANGWGNRGDGEGHGGYYGCPAYMRDYLFNLYYSVGSLGLAPNNSYTTPITPSTSTPTVNAAMYNTPGTYTLMPAR